jgi:hypothetical protein
MFSGSLVRKAAASRTRYCSGGLMTHPRKPWYVAFGAWPNW